MKLFRVFVNKSFLKGDINNLGKHEIFLITTSPRCLSHYVRNTRGTALSIHRALSDSSLLYKTSRGSIIKEELYRRVVFV